MDPERSETRAPWAWVVVAGNGGVFRKYAMGYCLGWVPVELHSEDCGEVIDLEESEYLQDCLLI